MITVACAIISSAKRWALVRDQILPQCVREGFDEIVVAGDGEPGLGYQFIDIPAITGTTIDALVKRDAATVATESEYIAFFSDDHRPVPGFATDLREYVQEHRVEVLIPHRVTWRATSDGFTRIDLNSGASDGYCGGHAGVFHREAIRRYPWACGPHDLLWDLTHSRHLQQLGVQFSYAPHIMVEDIEHFLNPEAQPWR